jgi:hypothetical protein
MTTKTTILAAAILLTACDPNRSASGGYLMQPGTAIAVGSTLCAAVFDESGPRDPGSNPPSQITAAFTSDDPSVLDALDASAFSGSFGGSCSAVLKGVGEGSAKVYFDAQAATGDRSDSFAIAVRKPAQQELFHVCTGDDTAAYLVGSDIAIGYRLRDSSGATLYGVLPPASVAPAGVLSGPTFDWPETAWGETLVERPFDPRLPTDSQGFFDVTDVQPLHFTTAPQTGTARIGPTAQGRTLTAEVVREGDVDNLEVVFRNPADDKQLSFGPFSMRAGEVQNFRAFPTVGGVRLCNASLAMHMNVETPATCETLFEDNPSRYDQMVRGKASGRCRFTLTIASANGGAGVSTSAELTVE